MQYLCVAPGKKMNSFSAAWSLPPLSATNRCLHVGVRLLTACILHPTWLYISWWSILETSSCLPLTPLMSHKVHCGHCTALWLSQPCFMQLSCTSVILGLCNTFYISAALLIGPWLWIVNILIQFLWMLDMAKCLQSPLQTFPPNSWTVKYLSYEDVLAFHCLSSTL